MELLFPMELIPSNEGNSMQSAIERIMHTYGMIRTLSLGQEAEIRAKVTSFLAKQAAKDASEHSLTISGLRFLHNLEA
jgi:hypothetical protein